MYLSKIKIQNYKGIENLEVNFSPKINIIIGENGSCKSAVIDAIRLLYNLGEPIREISISNEDFHENISKNSAGTITSIQADLITITYEFRGLDLLQKGAFYEYMVVDVTNSNNDYAKIELQYRQDKKYPLFSYTTGNIAGQKADTNTFRLFQHYYLGALRDSTKDLLNVRNNILGRVIKRLVDRNKSEDVIKLIIKEANDKLLERDEVSKTKDNINNNLDKIFKAADRNQIALHIEQSKIEYIVNVIKPYLPHDSLHNSEEGFNLWQNSLGFNNLIYIATVLGDIKERIVDDPIAHFALLIEEPEAHIHPQLQLSLYNFLKNASDAENSQLFITSHSPTLTSKVPFENLILLDRGAYVITDCFKEREPENLIQDTTKNKILTKGEIDNKKNQLQRYIDVTKSQLFFAKSCLFVEGISEELLISAFCEVEEFKLEDYRIELVNIDGISFYPFMFLFNSTSKEKRLPKKIAILTDDDRYPNSKDAEYNIEKLIELNYAALDKLKTHLISNTECNRVKNLNSVANKQSSILIKTSIQTMEFDICFSNVIGTKTELKENFLFKYLEGIRATEMTHLHTLLDTLSETLTQEEKYKIAILMWKCLPTKADFAQEFSIHIFSNITDAKSSFKVPVYMKEAFNHLKK